MNKTTALRAFNTLFFDFVDDLISIFPNDRYLVVARTSFEAMKSFNTSIIIKRWFQKVCIPYSEQILLGDLTFFIEKDYKADLNVFRNAEDLLKFIEQFREKVREMSEENRKTSFDYLKKLCVLSDVYSKFDL